MASQRYKIIKKITANIREAAARIAQEHTDLLAEEYEMNELLKIDTDEEHGIILYI